MKVFWIDINDLHSLRPNSWLGNIKCYELHTTIDWNDEQFINILNHFQIVQQLKHDINIKNGQCFRSHQMIQNFHSCFIQMKQGQNIMNSLSCKP